MPGPPSNLTSKALARFHEELGEDSIFQDISSPEEVLSAAKALEPLQRSASGSPGSLFRLESILGNINDFAAIFALGSGAEPRVTGAVWGSLKILLMLASTTNDTLGEVLNMLDEMSLTLPRFRSYEESLPMTPALERALTDVYAEITCFCARAVRFLRSAPHRFLVRAGWSQFDGDFRKTVKRLRTLSQRVDQEANTIRLKAETGRHVELVEAMESLGKLPESTEIETFHYVPYNRCKPFFGREAELASMDEELSSAPKHGSRCVLLHGLGGMGKSRLALEYIGQHRNDYGAIIWIPADNGVKVQQACAEVARQLQLVAIDESDALQAQRKVSSWLSSLEKRWLLVLDNVDDSQVLEAAPPLGSLGSLIVTSRDPTIAFGATSSKIQLQPFDQSRGTEAILNLLGKASASDTERSFARGINEALGGLPLAITQISGFIAQQKLSMSVFVPLYERNAARINRRSVSGHQDEHILSTVWAIAIQTMASEPRHFQSLLAFFDPDKIQESILIEGIPYLQTDRLNFILDEIDFMDAKEPLLKRSLLQRDETDSSLSMHRLVQFAILESLSPQERTAILDNAVTILSHGFENSWNVVTTHQFKNWKHFDQRIAHVQALINRSRQFNIVFGDPTAFSELIFRCAWFFYEKELYALADSFIERGLEVLGPDHELSYASACTLRGLVQLDTLDAEKALCSFLKGLAVRERLLPAHDAFIASSLNAISLAYTELGKLAEAQETGNRAIQIRRETQSDRIGNSYSNMASTLLRMGKHEEAEAMLAQCPSLKDFTDETFLSSGNPRFAGDMILLGRIRVQQGRSDDAIRLISKALAFRQRTHGNHLKTCDTMQLLAQVLQLHTNYRSAITLWDQSESIAANLLAAVAYQIRARYRLAHCYKLVGEKDVSRVWKEKADAANIDYMSVRGRPAATPVALEEAYDDEVAWMLW
ncbi:hypothetical protein D0861_08341 [Hortaea werneckii]|uniref:Uncharacterized protein n=1 Tax=Hortaea werneckii TaxID=91943 RepID=A0A3M7EXU2_HORWE|nr:hypothetical protein D0861_08341 [Hortaea werneckii]